MDKFCDFGRYSSLLLKGRIKLVNVARSHRQDLDLIRGLAIILVVVYHLDPAFMPSGFIGVDIFFVLSGYLIYSIYSDGLGAIDFYERRLRRLLPAMLFVALLVLLISPFVFLPFEVYTMVDSIVGTILFVPNIIFWRDNDYFSNLAFAPMLHYWSLGVELQYYALFPLLFFFFSRFKFSLAVLTGVSMIACVLISIVSAKFAFYWLPTRLWEFLAGGSAYLITRNYQEVWAKKLPEVWPYVALGSLVLLVGLSFVTIPPKQYPGTYAIPVVLFSVAFIIVGITSERLLDSWIAHVISWLAKLSFSIYLTHFVVFFIFKYKPFSETHTLSSYENILCIGITLGLSYVSYRFVEKPFRSKKTVATPTFLATMSFLIATVVVGLVVFRANNYFIDKDGPEFGKIYYTMFDRGGWRCSKLNKIREFGAGNCSLNSAATSERVVFLVGDSHVDVIKDEFVSTAVDKNIQIRINSERCALGLGQCSEKYVLDQVTKYSVTDVVLHGYDYSNFDYSELLRTVTSLSKKGIRTHIIGPVPTYSVSVPFSLYKEMTVGKSELKRIDLINHMNTIPDKYTEFLKNVETMPGVYSYNPAEIFCTPECAVTSDDRVYYFDSNHLTLSGAKLLNEIIETIYRSGRV